LKSPSSRGLSAIAELLV